MKSCSIASWFTQRSVRPILDTGIHIREKTMILETIKVILCSAAVTFFLVLACSFILVGLAVIIADRHINGK